ncbi:MAG TPA: MFS transporter [Nocardioides sp.]|nr:MFS transporter [Nocardioides sp.]
MIRTLRRRDVALLWTAGLVSVAGDWALMAALPYFVYQETGSTIATAGMAVAELVPGMVLSTFAGVFVDRWDRRRVLVVANLAQAVTVLGLLLARDPAWLWVVFPVAFVQSSAAAFSGPAESALLPSLVPPEELVPVNALNALNNRLGRLAGLPLGAVVFATTGLAGVVVVDALTFLAASALVAAMSPVRREQPDVPPRDEVGPTTAIGRVLDEWRAGLVLVRDDRTVAVLFAVFGVMTFGGTMLDPLYVPWIRDVLGAGAGTYAMLMTVHALAGMGGSVLVGTRAAAWSPRLLMGVGSLVAGLLLLVKFNAPLLWVTVLTTAVGGATSVASSIGVEALAQQQVPDGYRGRVFGSLQSTVWAMSLLGAAVGGGAGEVVGVLPAINAAALLVAVSGVVVLVAIPRRPRAAPARR